MHLTINQAYATITYMSIEVGTRPEQPKSTGPEGGFTDEDFEAMSKHFEELAHQDSVRRSADHYRRGRDLSWGNYEQFGPGKPGDILSEEYPQQKTFTLDELAQRGAEQHHQVTDAFGRPYADSTPVEGSSWAHTRTTRTLKPEQFDRYRAALAEEVRAQDLAAIEEKAAQSNRDLEAEAAKMRALSEGLSAQQAKADKANEKLGRVTTKQRLAHALGRLRRK